MFSKLSFFFKLKFPFLGFLLPTRVALKTSFSLFFFFSINLIDGVRVIAKVDGRPIVRFVY